MKLRLIDLPDMHPCLLWDDIIAAAVAVLDERGFSAPFRFSMDVQDLPGYDNVVIDFQILKSGVTSGQIGKVRRTYESHRLIELAAIAIAGLGLFAAGGHQIRDVALRGSSADYLVDVRTICLKCRAVRDEAISRQRGMPAGTVCPSVPVRDLLFVFQSSKHRQAVWRLELSRKDENREFCTISRERHVGDC